MLIIVSFIKNIASEYICPMSNFNDTSTIHSLSIDEQLWLWSGLTVLSSTSQPKLAVHLMWPFASLIKSENMPHFYNAFTREDNSEESLKPVVDRIVIECMHNRQLYEFLKEFIDLYVLSLRLL